MNHSFSERLAARELILIMTILGVVMGTLGCDKPDRGATQKADMRNVIIAAEIFRSEKQTYPTSLAELEDFLQQDIPTVDAWEQPIRFEFSKGGVKCSSNGPDRITGTLDDLVWMTQDEGF